MVPASKLKRLPLRGMLGNGLRVVTGAIAAYDGTIAVTTRGHRLTLAVDKISGLTEVLSDEPAPDKPGTEIDIAMPSAYLRDDAKQMAELSIAVARQGEQYTGPSLPAWYSAADPQDLFARVTPAEVTGGALVRDIFGIDDDDRRLARELTLAEIERLHKRLLRAVPALADPIDIGFIGNDSDEFMRTPPTPPTSQAQSPSASRPGRGASAPKKTMKSMTAPFCC